MVYECVKIKYEFLDKKTYKNANKQAFKLVRDKEFLRACMSFFGQDNTDNFFLPSREEILNEEALFNYPIFRVEILKFGDAFGYEATYSFF